MKCVIPLFVFLLTCFHSYGSAIDSLKTKEDVVNFLSAKIENRYAQSHLFRGEDEVPKIDSSRGIESIKNEIWRFQTQYGSNNFYKLDIDHNGKTDLIVDGLSSFIVLDMGDKYEQHFIGWDMRYFMKAITFSDQTLGLVLSHHKEYPYSEPTSIVDTLVYKFGGLVEYNAHPQYGNISSFYLNKHSACFGDCTDFFLEVNKNAMVIYNQFGDPNDSGSILIGAIDSIKFSELWDLAAYLNIKSLGNYYSIAITEMETGLSETYFEDGSVKKITDYGFSGTIGLGLLYRKIFELIKTQNWQPWYNSPVGIDKYLLECRVPFIEGDYNNYHHYFADDEESNNNKPGKTFVSVEGHCGHTRSCYITLFPDHHFVYKYQLGLCENISNYERDLLALGNWANTSDSTILLNWDGLLTLKTARNKEECKKYFGDNSVPVPLKIRNWSFTYTSDKRMLNPSKIEH